LQPTGFLTQYYRIARIIIHTIVGLMLAAIALPFVSKKNKLALIQWWCKGLLGTFNIKVIVIGNVPPLHIQGAMLICNHVSWADIHVLNSLVRLRFIAKSEIKSWPVFGYLVQKANTLFIDRSKRQEAGRIVDIATSSLKAGDNLCFFPEGTTSVGTQILPFKSSVLQAAINANATVWPIAIRYVNAEGSVDIRMAYAGETTMAESMKAVIAVKNPIVECHFLAPIYTQGLDRRALTEATFQAIKSTLAL
jgi:1-acyl-sn-glycerol-3-phosphate acyltransferase